MDDETNTVTCIGGTNYRLVFGPNNNTNINPSPSTSGATFNIVNNCSCTVWAAAVPGGGQKLDNGQTWTLSVNSRIKGTRAWARTGYSFNSSGHGQCETGDCNGLLECQAYGKPSTTLAKFVLNQYDNLDFFDISLVDGFNVPIDFSPTGGCARGIQCLADISGQCPAQLKTTGGCNNPYTVFKTDEYC